MSYEWFNTVLSENVVTCAFYFLTFLMYWLFSNTFMCLLTMILISSFMFLDSIENQLTYSRRHAFKFVAHLLFFYFLYSVISDFFGSIFGIFFFFGFGNTTIFTTLLTILACSGFLKYIINRCHEYLCTCKNGLVVINSINKLWNLVYKIKNFVAKFYLKYHDSIHKISPLIAKRLYAKLSNINSKLGENAYSRNIQKVYKEKTDEMQRNMYRYLFTSDKLFNNISSVMKMPDMLSLADMNVKYNKNNGYKLSSKKFDNNLDDLIDDDTVESDDNVDNIDNIDNADSETTENSTNDTENENENETMESEGENESETQSNSSSNSNEVNVRVLKSTNKFETKDSKQQNKSGAKLDALTKINEIDKMIKDNKFNLNTLGGLANLGNQKLSHKQKKRLKKVNGKEKEQLEKMLDKLNSLMEINK
jgi:hypothetical protein